MEILLSHISYLLMTNRFVAVEGLGAFFCTLHNASLKDGVLLTPPTDCVSFDQTAICNDDSLVRSIARREGLADDGAMARISEGVAAIRSALSKGEHVVVPSAGTLSYDAEEDMLVFDPAERSGWLQPVDLNPIVVASEKPLQRDAALESRREALSKSLRRTASSAAAIAIVALVTFIVSQLPSRHQIAPQVASMGIEHITQAASQDDPVIITPGAADPALVLILNTPSDGTAPAKQRIQPAEKKNTEPSRYCLIVASLASKSEAEKFIDAHSTADMPLSILQTDGRWRIYASSASTIEELTAIGHQAGIYESYPSAWICRR